MTLRTRLTLVAVVISLLTGCVGPFAPEKGLTFKAVFTRTNNVFEGSEVRIMGVRKGQVLTLSPEGDNVVATLEMDPGVDVPADVQAAVAPTSLLGERFIQLDRSYTGGEKLKDGEVVPIERTSVGVDIDEVLASFEKFLEGLDEDTLADLVDVMVAALEGQGDGLNQLLDQGSETVSVLRRSSDDLNTAVTQLAELNTTVAKRDEEVGVLFDDLSVVMRTIADEGPQIIEGMRHLRRLVADLRPIAEEHSDALVQDLEILATSVSTVERNLDRVGEVFRGSNRLFKAAGRGIDFEHAAIRLDNEAENIPALLNDRLIERLSGVCIRIGLDECADPRFFEPIEDIITCVPSFQTCTRSDTTFGEAFLRSLDLLPRRARKTLEDEAKAEQRKERRQRRNRDAEPEPTESPSPDPLDRLPLPDPSLQSSTSDRSFSDTLSGWLGGGS